jgi:hypothetical protein
MALAVFGDGYSYVCGLLMTGMSWWVRCMCSSGRWDRAQLYRVKSYIAAEYQDESSATSNAKSPNFVSYDTHVDIIGEYIAP